MFHASSLMFRQNRSCECFHDFLFCYACDVDYSVLLFGYCWCVVFSLHRTNISVPPFRNFYICVTYRRSIAIGIGCLIYSSVFFGDLFWLPYSFLRLCCIRRLVLTFCVLSTFLIQVTVPLMYATKLVF